MSFRTAIYSFAGATLLLVVVFAINRYIGSTDSGPVQSTANVSRVAVEIDSGQHVGHMSLVVDNVNH